MLRSAVALWAMDVVCEVGCGGMSICWVTGPGAEAVSAGFVLALACGDRDPCRAVDVGFSSGSGMGRSPLGGNSGGFRRRSGTAGASVMRRGSCSAFDKGVSHVDFPTWGWLVSPPWMPTIFFSDPCEKP